LLGEFGTRSSGGKITLSKGSHRQKNTSRKEGRPPDCPRPNHDLKSVTPFTQTSAHIIQITMTQFFLLLLVRQLTVFDLRSDIDWAYRSETWQEADKLISTILFADYYTHRIDPKGGLLFFRLKITLRHQDKWETAANCIENSFNRFPETSQSNRLQSLLGWSGCAHQLGGYTMSIRIAKKFH